MKKLRSVLLMLSLLLALAACGEKEVQSSPEESISSQPVVQSSAEPTPAPVEPVPAEPETPAPPEPEAPSEAPEPEETEEEVPAEPIYDEGPVSGDLGDYHVTILGAEDFVTLEGEPGIRFYYDFTNNSDSPAPAWAVLNMEARQDDYELVTAYAEFGRDVPEYPNDSLRIQPGMTIRCVEEYNFKPLGGMLEFTLSDLAGEGTLTMHIDPDQLQGRPEELEMPTITEPQWLLGVSHDLEGSAFYVQFHGYELTTNMEGGDAIRVYYEYTNKGDIPNAFFFDLNLLAFQDGVELQYSWMEESTQEENNSTLEIQPGESIVVASVYDLRGESPVDIYVEAMWEDGCCGVTVPVLSYPDE